MKFKIYGASDDLVEVVGLDHEFEDEFGCYDQKAIFTFSDGTVIHGLYAPDKTACWRFNVVRYAEAFVRQTQRGTEEGCAEDADAPVYSDVFTIEHDNPNFTFEFSRTRKEGNE